MREDREDNFVREAWVKVPGRDPKKYTVTLPAGWRRLRRGSRVRAGDKWFDPAGWRWVSVFVDGGKVLTSTLCIRRTVERKCKVVVGKMAAEDVANARLIALAPELLLALENLERSLTVHEGADAFARALGTWDVGARLAAREIIAKAKGTSL